MKLIGKMKIDYSALLQIIKNPYKIRMKFVIDSILAINTTDFNRYFTIIDKFENMNFFIFVNIVNNTFKMSFARYGIP